MQDTFPHPQHRLLNKAVPGTTSLYTSPCVLQIVPPDADFVLLEYTFNDAERVTAGQSADDPTRWAICMRTHVHEGMCRHVLHHQNVTLRAWWNSQAKRGS